MSAVVRGVPPVPVERRRLFWRAIGAGSSLIESAAAAGVAKSCGQNWFREAGGVRPFIAPAGGNRLSFADREDIAAGVAAGLSIRLISAGPHRAPSTVSREIKAGSSRTNGYRASYAQSLSDRRARRPKVSKLAMPENVRLREEVQRRLREDDSPEQISHRLRVDFPADLEMRVSHETIYQGLYVVSRGALNRELRLHLRTGRELRKPHRTTMERRGRIPNMVNISQRPPEVENRAVPGHWEGDLIVGKNSGSAIGTLVERMTGFVMLLHLPGAHGPSEVATAMIAAMSALPETLRLTLTWDQGTEMRNHARIAAAADLDIYFCDPRSPWQRGTNENTNGLLRQYFPKSTDLSGYTADYLQFVAYRLNNRPRKRLDWQTPAEKLDRLLSEPLEPGVATTA